MRKRVSRRASSRIFKRTASRVHRRNIPKYISRGGVRL